MHYISNLGSRIALKSNFLDCIRNDYGEIQLQFIVMNVVDHNLIHNEGRLERQHRVRQVASKDVAMRGIDEVLSRRTIS